MGKDMSRSSLPCIAPHAFASWWVISVLHENGEIHLWLNIQIGCCGLECVLNNLFNCLRAAEYI